MPVDKQMEFKKTRIAHAVTLTFTLAASMPALAGFEAPPPCIASTTQVTSAETATRFLARCESLNVTTIGSIKPPAPGMVFITGTGSGVYASGTENVAIINAGEIAPVSGSGISVASNAVVTSITNSGTIAGGSAGAALQLDNTIGSAFVVANTGTISGTIQLGINTLNVNGSSSVIDGGINGTGIVNVNGTWVRGGIRSISATTLNIIPDAKLEMFRFGTMNLSALNIDARGTLHMNQGGVIYGTVNNSGVLAVGPDSTLSVSGTYNQTSTGVFRTRVVDDGGVKYGKLLFTGNPATPITLQPGFKINVDVFPSTLNFAENTVLTEVIKAPGTLNSDTFVVTDNSLLFNFVAEKNGTSAINLKVTTQGAPTAVEVVTATSEPTPVAAAAVVDVLIANPGEMTPLINALGALSTSTNVTALIKKTLPLMITSVKQSGFMQQRSGDRVIQAHLERNSGLSSGDEVSGDRRAWAKPFGSWADQSDLKGVTGYKSTSGGILVGADKLVSATTRLGGALSYSTSKIDNTTSTNHADVTAMRFIGYGTYSLDSNTDLNFQADIGTSNTKGLRVLNAVGVTNIYSDYNTLTGGLSAGVGRSMAWNPKTTFTPSLRLSYAMMEDAAYTETNAEAFKGLNLMVAKSTGDELVALLEGKLNHELSESSKLVFNLGAGYDFLAKKSSLAASYTGGGGQFVTNGMDIAPWSYRAGVGYVSQGKKLELTTRYEVEAREGSTNQVASLKLRMPF